MNGAYKVVVTETLFISSIKNNGIQGAWRGEREVVQMDAVGEIF